VQRLLLTAAAKTDEPRSEVWSSILEPFIDANHICTLTGFSDSSSGGLKEKHLKHL